MSDNPYHSPASDDELTDQLQMTLKQAAIRGAKMGALIGLALVIGVAMLLALVMLGLAVWAETRHRGGFFFMLGSFWQDKSAWKIIRGFLATSAVLAGWGAILGALLNTASVWSRRKG